VDCVCASARVRSCVCRSFYVAALIISPAIFILPAAPVEPAIARQYIRRVAGKLDKFRDIDPFSGSSSNALAITVTSPSSFNLRNIFLINSQMPLALLAYARWIKRRLLAARMETSQTRRTRLHVPAITYTHVRHSQLTPFYKEIKKSPVTIPRVTTKESKSTAGDNRAVVKKKCAYSRRCARKEKSAKSRQK